jgi:hypothetical protein
MTKTMAGQIKRMSSRTIRRAMNSKTSTGHKTPMISRSPTGDKTRQQTAALAG